MFWGTDMKKNDESIVSVDAYSAEGYGVARVDGRAVFIPRALVDEVWRIRLVKVTASAVYARGIELISASPARIEADCPCFGQCGGCDTRHMSYEEELHFKLRKVNDALRRIGGQQRQAEEILGSDRVSAYRNKAIFAVAEIEGEPAFGFYRERSHELIPIQSCLLQSELSCRAAATVVSFMRDKGIAAYDESSGKGCVRHVFCRQACHGHDALLCIVAARGFGSETAALVQRLRQDCPELTGIVLNINKTRGNTVLAGDFYTLWGSELVLDELCGLRFSISPQAFFQVNPPQAEKLYALAAAYAQRFSPQLILDLYCGTGTIGLCLSSCAEQVIGAELVPKAIDNARENARRNGIENAEFICADAGQAAQTLLARGVRPDVVVVDPPRKGLEACVVETVASLSPRAVIYVSCNPATLARDIQRFNGHGYELDSAAAVDMFPRTAHVETVCLLTHA